MNFINFLWSAPLQIIISLFFLYNEIGWAAFMALVVMVLIAPLSMFFTTKVSYFSLLYSYWLRAGPMKIGQICYLAL